MAKKLTMKALIGNLLFLAILLLILTRFLTVWSGTIFPLNLIAANSMFPTLMEGDVIAVVPGDIEDVEVGDIIVFKSWLHWPDERFIVHRVVEIKQAFGKQALVTKGDANNFTDQAGPHIVEPYVTQKNFIGKPLSIGSIPLKIPLVGLIGIWVNEGLNALAQPTASKGSLTYVGVFTPLTVSVLLLIMYLFVVPEKKATFKEKIRYHMFGSHTLSVKNIFLTFLFLYIFLLLLIHVFAYDTIGGSIGVGEFPDDSPVELGSISPGSTTRPRLLPLFNPGVLPVKGIIYGEGQLADFVDRTQFEIGSGEQKEINITATAPATVDYGSYKGQIKIYSSPIWFMFPDETTEWIVSVGSDKAVYILDILSACILTFLTMGVLVMMDLISKNLTALHIDFSWHHISRVFLKKGISRRYTRTKQSMKHSLGKKIGWIANLDLAAIDPKKPILVSLVLIPLFLLIDSEILAMATASIIAGIAAYFISCKLRNKIVLASIITLCAAVIYLIIQTFFTLSTSGRSVIASITLGMGLVGVYLLVLAVFLLPIAYLTWYIVHQIRNLKERKEPLLVLEGRCDL